MPRNTPSASSSFEATADYQAIAASQTKKLQGQVGTQGGSVGDYCRIITIIPGTTSPGAVTLQDGNGAAITIFTGGSTSVSGLAPFQLFLDLIAVNTTTPGWTIVTGAAVSVLVSGEWK